MKEKRKDPRVINARFLDRCDIVQEEFEIEPFTMVIFGGSGDLSQRKLLPTLYHLFQDKRLPKSFSIIGFGLPEKSDRQYRGFIRNAIKRFTGTAPESGAWDIFSRHLFYISSDFKTPDNYSKLCSRITEFSEAKKSRNVIFYLAIPPAFVPMVADMLSRRNLCKGSFKAKIIIEKPFGRGRKTAMELNRNILKAFDESQIYRIDHYLGKETVQNIIFFRFGNSIFEPLWNRRYIDHIQITVAEDLGIEHRGAFYEQAGVVRDIVQNHIMQLVALVAMEPPVGFEADLIRDEKVKVLNTIRPMDDDYINTHTVRGQYGPGRIGGRKTIGYRREENVSAASNTPTFMAAKLYIDNWRWAGVPFYIRTGKRLPRRVTEIVITFKQPPLKLFGRTCDAMEPNSLIFGIQPVEEICLRLSVKYPGIANRPHPVHMRFNYENAFKINPHLPYERLLIDCMRGDLTLFARQDGIEAMWSVVDPIIGRWEKMPPKKFPNYPAGSWGPKESVELMRKDGRQWCTV